MPDSIIGTFIKQLPEAAQSQLNDSTDLIVEDTTTTRRTKLLTFANWIKTKLGIGTATSLSTGSKNIVGAINELNTNINNRIEMKNLAGVTGSTTVHLAAGKSIFLFVIAIGGISNPLVFAGIAAAANTSGSDTKIYPIVVREDGNSSVVSSGNAIIITCGWTYEIKYFYLF